MNDQRYIWQNLVSADTRDTLHMVMRRAVGTLSFMTEWLFNVEDTWVDRIPISQIEAEVGNPEEEMVGVYLRVEDGLDGHALLILPLKDAFELVDSLLGQPQGTTKNLRKMEYSALAEVGNLIVSYFLNAVADIFEENSFLRPSPPAITVDMLGAILNTIVIPLAEVRDDLLVLGTTFRSVSGEAQISFWILPDCKYQDLQQEARR